MPVVKDFWWAAFLDLGPYHYQTFWPGQSIRWGPYDYTYYGFDYAGGTISIRDTSIKGGLIFPYEFRPQLVANNWFQGQIARLFFAQYNADGGAYVNQPITLYWQVSGGSIKENICTLDLIVPGTDQGAAFPGRQLISTAVGRLPLSGQVQSGRGG